MLCPWKFIWINTELIYYFIDKSNSFCPILFATYLAVCGCREGSARVEIESAQRGYRWASSLDCLASPCQGLPVDHPPLPETQKPMCEEKRKSSADHHFKQPLFLLFLPFFLFLSLSNNMGAFSIWIVSCQIALSRFGYYYHLSSIL